MKVNYSEIKTSFWKYLEQLQDPSIDLSDPQNLSIFSFSDKFKSFLSSEYNFDESIFSYNLNDVLDMPVVDGQFTDEENAEAGSADGTQQLAEFAQLQEQVEEQTQDAQEGEETLTEETDENNFFKEFLNEFLQDTDVKNVVDADKNGQLSDEEIDNFFKQIAGNDENADDLSMEDIKAAFEQIKDGSFVLGTDTETPETQDIETPQATDVPETQGTQETSTPRAGGTDKSGGTHHSSGNDKDTTNDKGTQDTTVNYSTMTLEELNTEKGKKDTELKNAQDALNAAESGSNTAVSEKQAESDKMRQAYEEAVQNDQQISADLKKKITDNNQAIADKELEVHSTQLCINDKNSEIYAKTNEIADIKNSIDALTTSKTKLEEQKGKTDDATKLAEIEKNIKEIDEKLKTANDNKTKKEGELEKLNADKTALEGVLADKQSELKTLNDNKTALDTEINNNASDTTKDALKNFNDAKAAVETTRQEELKTAQSTLDTVKADYDKLTSAIRDKEAAKTEKDYKVGKADLFTSSEFSFQHVDRDGMDYILIGPKDADPNEELPVMVYLHGSGEQGEDLSDLEGVGLYNMLNKHKDEFGETFNGYILMPQTPKGWKDKGQQVKDIVNEFAQTHAIDRDNVVIAGHSLGSIGVLAMAGTNDDHFFSRALVLSAYNPGDNYLRNINIPVLGYGENNSGASMLEKAGSAGNYHTVKADHGAVPRKAFGIDANGNNRSDIIEWLFPDYAD